MSDEFSISLGNRAAYGGAHLLTTGERARHIYAIGRTGSGKTTLLRSIALQDIHAGRGVCVIDPHGDNVQALADSIPRSRINDTIYFDAGDREHVIAFNPLDHGGGVDDAELVASELVTMFKGLFRDSWGEWLEYLLKHALLTVLAQKNVPVSLVSLQRILDEEGYRTGLVDRLDDPVIRGFWEKYFGRLREREELERISSTLNKVGKFALSPVLRNILGQARSGFDLRRAMDERQIVLVNLSKGRIGADNANFLGSAILSKLVSLALRRSAVPESERVPFYLSIDEFQNFTSDEFTTIVSEARKYALSLLVAHQNYSQISPRVVDQVIKEAGTLIAFKVAFEDNERLATAFLPLNANELASTRDGAFWLRSGASEPALIQGYAPDELDRCRTGSFGRVARNSRWRYSRPRAVVERDFRRWYRSGKG
jgi:DNA helicase HerA-like ATPase